MLDFLSAPRPKSENNVDPLGGAAGLTATADAESGGFAIMMDRIFAWFLLSGHPNPAVKWVSAPYVLFSIKFCVTTGFYPEKLAALPMYYNFVVPVCWMLVLHLAVPLCIYLKDGARARIAQLAKAKIRGNAEMDENMCFEDPQLQDKLRLHGQAQKKWQEIGGFALICIGSAKLAIEGRGLKPGGALDPISPMEVRIYFMCTPCPDADAVLQVTCTDDRPCCVWRRLCDPLLHGKIEGELLMCRDDDACTQWDHPQ